jgi:hypothetical protein
MRWKESKGSTQKTKTKWAGGTSHLLPPGVRLYTGIMREEREEAQ